MSHPYKKDADASHDKKIKSYGGESKAKSSASSSVDEPDSEGDATNFAGFKATNTDKQAGRAPLNSKNYLAPETRIQKKKGGAVSGAQSLKRLDKAPRGKKADGGKLMGTGQRVGQIPSGTTQQEQFDPQTVTKPGMMNPTSPRKKGGRVAKAYGGGLEEILGNIADSIFGPEEAEAAPARTRAAAPRAAHHAAPARRAPVLRKTVTEVEHPDIPLPPRRPAMPGAEGAPVHDTTYGRPDEGGMRSFLDKYGSAAPAPTSAEAAVPPTGAAAGMPDEGGMRPFLTSMMTPEQVQMSSPALTQLYNARKKGGRVQHEDEAEDRALIKKMVKKEDLTGKCSGGSMGRAKRATGGGFSPEELKDAYSAGKKRMESMPEEKVRKLKEGYTGGTGRNDPNWTPSPLDRMAEKRGGRTKRADGGGAWGDYGSTSSEGKSSGGKSKKGSTTVNIMIGQPGGGQQAGAMDALLGAAMAGGAGGPPAGAMPPPPPPGAGGPGGGMPPQMPPQMMMAPPPAAPPGPPPGAPPMPRKDGGKVQVPYKKPGRKGDYPAMDFGAGGGFGRRQKIDSYGSKGPDSKDNY